mmetsp:Transcript_25187/g.42495  ORF Transcript_25187/g.42495 Transcript_25187/m.42495 type:complete len:227 (-) Transcript_25187:741-1421(-)
MRCKHSAIRGVGAPALATTDVPRVAHHELKVVVIVDGSRHIAVVSAKLGESDLSILISSVEGVQELAEHLVAASLAAYNVGMFRGVVLCRNIAHINRATLVCIQELVGHKHKLLATLIQHASYGAQELVEVHGTALVAVKVVEEELFLRPVPREGGLVNSFAKLRKTDRLGVVVVHDLELARQSEDTSGAVRLKTLAINVKKCSGIAFLRVRHERYNLDGLNSLQQ